MAGRVHDRILHGGWLTGQREGIIGSGKLIGAGLPKLIPLAAEEDATQAQDVTGAILAPKHARLFATGPDDRFATGPR